MHVNVYSDEHLEGVHMAGEVVEGELMIGARLLFKGGAVTIWSESGDMERRKDLVIGLRLLADRLERGTVDLPDEGGDVSNGNHRSGVEG